MDSSTAASETCENVLLCFDFLIWFPQKQEKFAKTSKSLEIL